MSDKTGRSKAIYKQLKEGQDDDWLEAGNSYKVLEQR